MFNSQRSVNCDTNNKKAKAAHCAAQLKGAHGISRRGWRRDNLANHAVVSLLRRVLSKFHEIPKLDRRVEFGKFISVSAECHVYLL